MTLGLCQGLRRAVQLQGEKLALVDGPVRFTWRELADRVARLAGGLRGLGVAEGARVVLIAPNSHRSYETYYASLWAGGVITPLNGRLSDAELAALIADAEPAVLVLAGEFAQRTEVLRRAGGPMTAVVLAEDDPGRPGLEAYEALIAGSEPLPEAGRRGSDLACLFYTSGSTGEPKGVMLSHRNILANTMNFIGHVGLDERAVHLHHGPLFHVASGVRLFLTTQAAGRHVMLPRFDAAHTLETIARERVTIATFVPTMLRSILDCEALGRLDLSSLEYVTYGAAPMPEPLLREAMRRLPHVRFVQAYGMTETSPVATFLGWREHLAEGPEARLLRSAGRAALLAEVAVVGPDDQPLPPGETGEIIIRGPMVMEGYWRKPEATAAALRGGWMHSGDLGHLDEEGYLFVVDRLKDIIITGGENVSSVEVENVLASHPAVLECAVIGRPDPHWGEAVHAVVSRRPGHSVTADELIAHCKAQITSFKCPKTVEVRGERLPLSGANKILKHQLRAELAAAQSKAGAAAVE